MKFKRIFITAIIIFYLIFIIASIQTFYLIRIVLIGEFSFNNNLEDIAAPIFMLLGMVGGVRLTMSYIKYKSKV